MINWPEGKQFAFTIIDDTDNAIVANIKPVYDLLIELNMLTTKTVWVYPSRDHFAGQSLQDADYLQFIKSIHGKGFEIALHNVGSGNFNRDEIIYGFELFKVAVGIYPYIQINHSSNRDNIYWGYNRHVFPLRNLMKLLYKDKRKYFGTEPESEYFWGDLCKKHIKFIRNHCFNGINTLRYDSQMPYVNSSKQYSNYWFSSTDGHTVEEFTHLISNANVDMLERQKGACIVYTHFASGFVNSSGKLNENFEKQMRYLSSKNGWFVPAGELLEFLLEQKNTSSSVSKMYLMKLDSYWLKDRVIKRIRFRR